MNFNHILCPVDFSECSQLAVELAGKLTQLNSEAAIKKTKVVLLNIVESGSSQDRPKSLLDTMVADGLKSLRDKGKFNSDVVVEYLTLKGDPLQSIVEYAKRKKVGLIVMGTRGKTGLKKLLLGSVAEGVMKNAPCPVITVNPPSSSPSAPKKS